MTYRDSEIGQMRSQLNEVSERLSKFEALYAERGFSKTFARVVVEGLWKGITWPFRTLWSMLTSGVFWTVVIIIGVLGCGGWLWRDNDVRVQAEETIRSQHNRDAAQATLTREREAREAAEQAAAVEAQRIENEHQQEIDATYQILMNQCTSFCGTHGYSFDNDRRDNLCFCTSRVSNTVAFIINTDTSENWTVRP